MSFSKGSGDRSKRVDLGEFTLVRMKVKGFRFELIVYPEKAWLSNQGEDIPIEDIVEGFTIFENFSKGLKASDSDLEYAFETEDQKQWARIMVQKGDLQITQKMRNEFLKEKIAEIVNFLVKHTINPKTGAPHTIARIKKAMDEAGSRIDRNEPTKEQALRVMKDIAPLLPIKMEIVSIEFRIPPTFAGSLYGQLKNSGEMTAENWNSDGSLSVTIQIPAGIQAKIMEEISDKTKGKAQMTVLNRG